MAQERFLERIGLFKHHHTTEELEAGDVALRELTAEYMEGKIGLEEYIKRTDRLPKIDLVSLASRLNYKG